jgi:hypothetical protein
MQYEIELYNYELWFSTHIPEYRSAIEIMIFHT